MKRKCPYCYTTATYPHNLRTHLAGKYPGHGLPYNQAERIANEVFRGTYVDEKRSDGLSSSSPILPADEPPQTSESSTFFDSLKSKQKTEKLQFPDELQHFVEELFESLVENKKLPKYQFERRIDAILQLFLPDLLTHHFGLEVETIVAEFPLKKAGNRQSTNVDYLMAMRDSDNIIKYWLFFELKTDDSSVKDEQIDSYERAVRKNMPTLIHEIHEILDGTTAVSKYRYLLERLRFISDNDRTPIRVIYLSPTIPSRLRYPRELAKAQVYPLTFSELAEMPVRKFPESWDIFRRVVVPALSNRN